MYGTWVERFKILAERNLPSRKPQLWENLPLAVRRRIAFEVRHRVSDGWLDQPQVVELSEVGFDNRQPPLRMEVVPREVMNKALFLYGTFEISETRLVQSFLRPGMTFVDVGANIGYYTVVAARIVGTEGAVYAFEPNSEIRNRLDQNVRLNGLTNVTVSPEAVTQHSGDVHFYVSAVSENSGISSIVPGSGLSEASVVPGVSLDDFMQRIRPRRVDLLKMDIEGAELQAIEGGRQLLSGDDAPALLFESFKVGPLLSALRGLNYQVRRLHYTLVNGLELPDAEAPLQSLFDAYESPNYFAAKDPAIFGRIVARANRNRSSTLRLLGRI